MFMLGNCCYPMQDSNQTLSHSKSLRAWRGAGFLLWKAMLEHIIISDKANVYECLNCGFKIEPP